MYYSIKHNVYGSVITGVGNSKPYDNADILDGHLFKLLIASRDISLGLS